MSIYYQGNIFSEFSINSEANASKLLENLEGNNSEAYVSELLEMLLIVDCLDHK